MSSRIRSETAVNPQPHWPMTSRREFLLRAGGGFAGLALIDLLTRDGFFARAGEKAGPLSPKESHFPARARHVVFLFMNGAPSQVDTFDPKPELDKYDGKPYTGKTRVGSNNRPVGHLMRSPFEFTRHGKSGLPVSSLFPRTAKFADDLCVVRSLYTDTAAHAGGCLQLNTGTPLVGKPCLGSWLTYGLGTGTDSLPGFVVMIDPRGGPIGSASNWSAGFMPAAYQGTLFRGQGSPLLDLATPTGVSPQQQRDSLDLLKALNEEHRKARPEESELAARIESYELAFRMQAEATQVVDLSKEDAKTRAMYGLDERRTADFGRK